VESSTHGKDWQQKHSAAIKYLGQNPSVSSNEFSHFFSIIRAAEMVMTDLGISYIQYEHGKDIEYL
jgi:hypothetical protein